jgi:hypothetical protein
MVDRSNSPTNLAVLRGTVVGEVTRRVIADGTERVSFSLASPAANGSGGTVRCSVPVVSDAPGVPAPRVPAPGVPAPGVEVLVVGYVRQRFFRVGGATASRTEVVARHVVPVRRRRQVERLLDEVRRSLGGG